MWKRVYQGGHHDVWCDGGLHRTADGGYCHADREAPTSREDLLMVRRQYRCDCAYWKDGGWAKC